MNTRTISGRISTVCIALMSMTILLGIVSIVNIGRINSIVHSVGVENLMGQKKALLLAVGDAAQLWTLGILAFAVISGALFAFFIVRGVNHVLTQAVSELSMGAEQLSSASGQVSASSQSLAQGASEQAASLEETSASSE